MITATREPRGDEIAPIEMVGLSTDVKPVEDFDGYPVINGSSFLEMDTGDLYWFDGASRTWLK